MSEFFSETIEVGFLSALVTTYRDPLVGKVALDLGTRAEKLG